VNYTLHQDKFKWREFKAALPLWLSHYEASFHPLSADTRAMLDSISAATIDRLLKPIRAKPGRRGLSGTKPGTLLKKHIPIVRAPTTRTTTRMSSKRTGRACVSCSAMSAWATSGW
jgi:hypothetical protein